MNFQILLALSFYLFNLSSSAVIPFPAPSLENDILDVIEGGADSSLIATVSGEIGTSGTIGGLNGASAAATLAAKANLGPLSAEAGSLIGVHIGARDFGASEAHGIEGEHEIASAGIEGELGLDLDGGASAAAALAAKANLGPLSAEAGSLIGVHIGARDFGASEAHGIEGELGLASAGAESSHSLDFSNDGAEASVTHEIGGQIGGIVGATAAAGADISISH